MRLAALRKDLTIAAIPGFLVTMGLEYAILRRKATVGPHSETTASNVAAPVGYAARDTATSLAMGLGMLAIGAGAEKVLGPWHRRLHRHRVLDLGAGPGAVLGGIVLWDFLYYWEHRWSHEVRLMWAAHVNHHSSEHYNLSTALRQSWSGVVVSDWVFWPMLLLGWSPAQVARAGQANLLYQYWVHTEVVDKLPGWFEAVMDSASHHRVHHGSNKQYLDRNYGGILILWDRMFGTFEPEGERIRYGLTKNIGTHNPIRVAYHEWASIARDVRGARTWRDRLGHVFGPPGWQPAGATPVPDTAAVGVTAAPE